jgi:hypothetical protein
MNILDFESFSQDKVTEGLADTKVGKVFYKIIDKGKVGKWLKKNFLKDKKTMVTTSLEEVKQINDTKTAVKLTVPEEAIIDKEGKWAVLELYPVKDAVEVEEVEVK